MSNDSNAAPITAPSFDSASPTTLHDIVAYLFKEGHGFAPHEWQTQYISRVLEGSSTQSGNRPCPFLIYQSTGGGKSACRNNLSFIQGGVTLTIVPLLSLGADQTAKLQSLSDCKQLPVQIYHLDEYWARDANRSLCRLINELTDATITIFLFASPQELLSREWSDCIGSLIK